VLLQVVRLGLLQDLLRAGLSRDELTTAQQELFSSTVVLADRPQGAAALLRSGFAISEATRHDIEVKAIRSGAWREVSLTEERRR
jgi:hypothetical protein